MVVSGDRPRRQEQTTGSIPTKRVETNTVVGNNGCSQRMFRTSRIRRPKMITAAPSPFTAVMYAVFFSIETPATGAGRMIYRTLRWWNSRAVQAPSQNLVSKIASQVMVTTDSANAHSSESLRRRACKLYRSVLSLIESQMSSDRRFFYVLSVDVLLCSYEACLYTGQNAPEQAITRASYNTDLVIRAIRTLYG